MVAHFDSVGYMQNVLTPTKLQSLTLLSDSTLVESQLLTLEDIAVGAARLTGSRRDDSKQTTGLELTLQGSIDLGRGLHALRMLLLNALRLLLISNMYFLAGLLLSATTEGLAIVCLIPLTERSRIDLDNGGLGEGVCADEFVVGRVVGDADDAGLARDAFAAPAEVAGVEAQGAELAVTAAGADEMYALGADTGVGGLAAFLESSLLAIVCAFGTGGRTLVTGVTRNTHDCSW